MVNGAGILAVLEKTTLNPADPADVASGGTNITDNAGLWGGAFPSDPDYSATINPVTTELYPSGQGKADYLVSTVYEDGSTVSSRKLLVSNEGEVLGIGGAINSSTFLAEGSFNLELVIESSLFQGRSIDVLFDPQILTRKRTATTTADSFAIN